MKNTFTLILLSLIALTAFSQEKQDSTILASFDGTNFITQSKNVFLYNANNKLGQNKYFSLESNAWVLRS